MAIAAIRRRDREAAAAPIRQARPAGRRRRLLPGSLHMRAVVAVLIGVVATGRLLAFVLLEAGGHHDALTIILSGIAGTVAMILLGHLALISLASPVGHLARLARELAADSDVTVPGTERADEVGDLARALEAWRYASAERLALAKLAAEADARFRMVFDHAPIGLCRIGRDGRILDSNPTLQQMLGYGAQELLGMSAAAVCHPDDRDLSRERHEALAAGGCDRFVMETRYLKKDGGIFWGNLTVSAVRHPDGRALYQVAMIEDINERKEREQALQHRAEHDVVTGLPNRSLLHERLELALAGLAGRPREVGLMVLDLDGFKSVNDTIGHQAGDELLRLVAERFRSALRGTDLVARLGGDEFAVLLPDTDHEGTVAAARKLLRSLRRPFPVAGRTVRVGASVGIALHREGAETPSSLMHRADQAMYVAKRAGGGFEVSPALEAA